MRRGSPEPELSEAVAPRHRRWVRHGLLIRLLVICVAIAGCSIGATAWIVAASTSGSIQAQYSEDVTVGAKVYDQLLGYGATHPNWGGVDATVRALSRSTGRDIVLTTEAGAPLASSTEQRTPPRGAKPSVVVNALSVSSSPDGLGSGLGIDPRAAGPFTLTRAERVAVRAEAESTRDCLDKVSRTESRLVTMPNGRTVVLFADRATRPPEASVKTPSTAIPRFPDRAGSAPPVGQASPGGDAVPPDRSDVIPTFAPTATGISDARRAQISALTAFKLGCTGSGQLEAMPSELAAGTALLSLVRDCLKRQFSLLGDPVRFDTAREPFLAENLSEHLEPAYQGCVDSSRREQLSKYVAAPALVYLTGASVAEPRTGLTRSAGYRIGLLALLVVLVTVAVCALAASRLVRPLRALTAAAQRVGRGDRSGRVVTRDSGQIGELAGAFNRMSEELETAEDRRKQMVSDIAHELRTPLGNIRGWLEATQDGVVTFDEQLARSLLDESLLMQRVIEDLQDLALADAGKLVFHPEPLDVADLLRQVAAAHRATADAAQISLDVIAPEPVQLTADASRLRQALGNLVSNAVRYTPSGGLVMLRAERTGELVTIEVFDTGIGIRPEELPHVFDRFWRAEQSRSRLSGGSGLGLAITRHLVEAHHGTITVRSDIGGGTAFTIRLPVHE